MRMREKKTHVMLLNNNVMHLLAITDKWCNIISTTIACCNIISITYKINVIQIILFLYLYVSENMAEKKTGWYKEYLRKPGSTVPRTTKWRKHKKEEHHSSVSNVDDHGIDSAPTHNKRRAYNRDAFAYVPRQTKWFWKKTEKQQNRFI